MSETPQDMLGSFGSLSAHFGLEVPFKVPFKKMYSVTDKLGKGAFGSVWKVKHCISGDEFAVKIIDRRKLKPKDDRNVFREVEVMKGLSIHENIVSLIEFFETVDTFHVVIELARGGDLMRRITKRTRYSEIDGRTLAREFLNAVDHIHKCNIVHRDLKPDNLLMENNEVDGMGVKIADFGFAKELKGGQLKTRCGTPAYVAPEICAGVPYGKEVDVWSCGVILYLLLSGKIPFIVKRAPGQKHDLKALFLKIRGADYVFDDIDWGMISMSAKQLIAQMLTVDNKRRITIETAMKSPWMTKIRLSERHLNKAITNLKQFNARRSFKSALIATTFATTAKFWTSNTVTFMAQDTTFVPSKGALNSSTENKELTSGKVGQTFADIYRFEEKMKNGENGVIVWKGIKLATSDTYTIKVVKRVQGSSMSTEDNKVLNEVSILQSLSHYHVVKLYDFVEESSNFFLVMELMGGGDLFERIVKKEMYTEKDAREVAKAILSAVDYIHSRGVAHRDLKPQNLLLANGYNDTYVKVGDFGFAKRVHTPKSLFTRCGTPTYVAPEILKGHPYDQSVDVWSVGVIIYVALVGYPPFLEQDQRVMLNKIRHGTFEFYQEDWTAISEEARNLIKSLLKVDPDRRLTASKALDHRWIALIDGKTLVKNEMRRSLKNLSKRSQGSYSDASSAFPFQSFSTPSTST